MPEGEATRFGCPECSRPSLAAGRRLVLPGDRRNDQIALETLACACGFKALGVTEQPRRPALRDAAPERVGYRLPAAAVDLIAFLVARCPQPAEEYCTCSSHATLNRRDLRNGWNLLHSFAPFTGFALELELEPAPAPADAVNGTAAPALLEWRAAVIGHVAVVEGREWRLEPHEGAFELSIEGALGLDIEALPPFWRLLRAERPGS